MIARRAEAAVNIDELGFLRDIGPWVSDNLGAVKDEPKGRSSKRHGWQAGRCEPAG